MLYRTEAVVRTIGGNVDAGIESTQKALAIDEVLGGKEGPNTLMDLDNLSEMYRKQGRWKEAEAYQRRNLDGLLHLGGATNERATMVRAKLALLECALGRYDVAADLEQQALDGFKKRGDLTSTNYIRALVFQSVIERRRGHAEVAEGAAAEAEQICLKVDNNSRPECSPMAAEHARAMLAAGRAREAAAKLQLALSDRATRAPGTDSELRGILTSLGRAYLAMKQPQRAIPPLERAVKVEGPGQDPRETGAAPFVLAQALWSAPRERSRARHLAEEAETTLSAAGFDDEAEHVRAWLDKHRR
jgi:tetratricopeptide (TPR) repeat protein